MRGHPSHLHPVRVRSGGVESAGSGAVDEVVGAVRVAPEVDPRPGCRTSQWSWVLMR